MSKYTYIDAEITGERPFLMMAFDVMLLINAKPTAKRDSMEHQVPRDMAQKHLYKEEGTKKLYFPTTGHARLLREAGSSIKLKGERKAVKYKVPAAVLMEEDVAYFRNPNDKSFILDPNWEVDLRSGVNQKLQVRIPICRPRIDAWCMQFRLRINHEVLSEDIVHKLLQDGGEQIGLGSFRPEKGGTFGLFRVTSWQEAKK